MAAFFNRAPNMFGLDYTKRQNAILNEDIPLDEIRTTELVAIMKKATERADQLSYDIASSLYYWKTHPDVYIPKYTLKEAKAILQKLTPWPILWEDEQPKKQ